MRLLARVEAALLAQRGHLFPWVPVMLACGIGMYFALRFEPSLAVLPYVASAVTVFAFLNWRVGLAWAPLIWAMLLVATGFSLAMSRAHLVERPVLGWRFYGAVEGRVIGLDRSGSGALRVLLDKVVLAGMAPDETPEHVRVSLHGAGGSVPRPGARVLVTAHLSPPGGPVEPGGFDFQRHSWFLKLGAVGYARTPLLLLEPPGRGQVLFRSRIALSQRVQGRIDGETGAFAAAIMTGDRAGIAPATLEALRVSNLAHLLAISGLHMGLLAGFIFAVVRVGLALIPFLALRLPAKKIAAVIAIFFAAGYLALSGGNVATERAFVMVAVALLAVVADRRVISVRAVALAAAIVLVLRPESLLGPGFQMSFAATTALVAVFGWLRESEIPHGPSWLRPVIAVVISSAVAGAATAPIGAAHFNQISHFGLLANLLSVPLMGVLVIPALVVSALLIPIGLDWVGFAVAGAGLDWILFVAQRVSNLEGARGAVPSPEWFVLPMMGFGFLVVMLWRGRARLVGLVPVLAAFLSWSMVERPDILIADGGSLVGVIGPEGRALSKSRGAGFVAMNWLENDGDPVEQASAADRWERAGAGLPVRIVHVTGKKASENVRCAAGEIVVSNADLPENMECDAFDVIRLRQTGAVAFHIETVTGALRMTTAKDVTGERLWNRP